MCKSFAYSAAYRAHRGGGAAPVFFDSSINTRSSPAPTKLSQICVVSVVAVAKLHIPINPGPIAIRFRARHWSSESRMPASKQRPHAHTHEARGTKHEAR